MTTKQKNEFIKYFKKADSVNAKIVTRKSFILDKQQEIHDLTALRMRLCQELMDIRVLFNKANKSKIMENQLSYEEILQKHISEWFGD